MQQEKEEQEEEEERQGHLVRGGDLGDGRVRDRAVLHRAPRLVGNIVRLVESDRGVARAALRVLTADRKVALRKADTGVMTHDGSGWQRVGLSHLVDGGRHLGDLEQRRDLRRVKV